MRRRLLSELGIRVRIKFRLSPEVAVVHQERIVVLKGWVQVLKSNWRRWVVEEHVVMNAALHALILIYFYLLISGVGYPGLVVFQQIKHFLHQKQAAGKRTPAASSRRGTTNTQC